jgi:two-component system chemotaxis response regulator CheB
LPARDIVVVGASADGVRCLETIARHLPRDLPAAIFVVLHTGPTGGQILPEILSRAGSLPAATARDGEPIRNGRIYVAPGDYHLLLDGDRVKLSRGPRENRFRPAIDPLFRSAARHHGDRVIGVILSGLLDDGAIGLRQILDAGGVALVQNPLEATYPDMPVAALRRAPQALPLTLREIADFLATNTGEKGDLLLDAEPPADPAPEALVKRDDPVEGPDQLRRGKVQGVPTLLTCPDCGGSLQEVAEGDLVHYRCHVGHGFSPQSLLIGQEEVVEDALWQALRALEEGAEFRRRLAERARGAGLQAIAGGYDADAEAHRRRADVIRQVLEAPPGPAVGLSHAGFPDDAAAEADR